jgi:hypothetical protein
MERMLCAECAAVTYSAAARKLVARGERCPRCGGELSVDTRPTVAVTLAREAPDDKRTISPRAD